MMNYVNGNSVRVIVIAGLLLAFSTFSKADDKVKFYEKNSYQWWTVISNKLTFQVSNQSVSELRTNKSLIETQMIETAGFNKRLTLNLNPSASIDDMKTIYQSVMQIHPDAVLLHSMKPVTNNPALALKEMLIDDKILVRFKTQPDKTALNQFMTKYSLEWLNETIDIPLTGGYTYIFKQKTIDPTKNTAVLAATIYENNSGIEVSNPNRVNAFTPNDGVFNDPRLITSWHLTNGSNAACGSPGDISADIQLIDVWNSDYTGQGVRVGVIDFYGFDYDHPDMQGRFLPGWDCINNKAYDATNYYYTNNSNAHGMAVTGIIAANANNAEGSAGVAYGAQIVPLLIDGSDVSVVLAIQTAMKKNYNVDVINCSWGSYYYSPSVALEIENATTNGRERWDKKYGIVFVASHGNDNYYDVSYSQFPTEMPEVISVGASTPEDKRKVPGDGWDGSTAWGSNYGENLDVVAPGLCIFSTDFSGSAGYAEGDYIYFSKTSAAAPIVSGLAALILSKDPLLYYNEVKKLIIDGAFKAHNTESGGEFNYYANPSKLGHCNDMGYGRINAALTLKTTPVGVNESKILSGAKFVLQSPVSQQLTINYTSGTSQDVVSLVLYDVNGKAIGREVLATSGGKANVDISALMPGVYISQFVTNGQVLDVQKFVKIR